MTRNEIPYYNDPEGFEDGDATYPCDSQFMIYDPLQHKYFLTQQALSFYGIDVERQWISSNPNKVTEFINKVTKKIYDYIQYKAGWKNFEVQMYRIATASSTQDKYTFRKQFEMALVTEAEWLITNGDSAKFSAENLEQGTAQVTKPENSYRDLTDLSKESIRTLEFLGLTRWFRLGQIGVLDTNKY